MYQERRSIKRLPLPKSVRYQQKGSQRFGNLLGRDINNAGIGFISNEFFPVFTHLIFEFQHPQTHEFIKAVGEVVWISNCPHSERFSAGARFIGPPLTI